MQTVTKRLTSNVISSIHPDAIFRTAILIVNDDILGNIDQTTGQITSFCSTQRGISQTLAGTMRGNEVFQRRQTFAEVGANRHGNNTTGRIRHQTAHTSHLGNRTETTFCRAGKRHNGKVTIRVHVFSDCLPNFVGGILPDFNDAVILFAFRALSTAKRLLKLFHIEQSFFDKLLFLRRHGNI